MINRFRGDRVITGFWFLLICAVLTEAANAAGADAKFIARDAEIAGARIHYLIS